MSKQVKLFRILVCAFLGAVVITAFLPVIGNITLFQLADLADLTNGFAAGSNSMILQVIAMISMYVVSLAGVVFLLTFNNRKKAFLWSAVFSFIAVAVSVYMIVFITDVTSVAESYLGAGSILGDLSDLADLSGYITGAVQLGISYPLALSFAVAGGVFSVLGMLQSKTPVSHPVSDAAVANIVCVSGEFTGAKFPIFGDDEIIIGRDPAVSHIVLSGAPKVSRKHCSIQFNSQKDTYSVTDFSSNGTYTQEGTRLNKNMVTPFSRGSTISLGNEDVQFRLD